MTSCSYIQQAKTLNVRFHFLFPNKFKLEKQYKTTNTDAIQIPANFFDINISSECHPSTSIEFPIRYRICKTNPQKSRESLTCLQIFDWSLKCEWFLEEPSVRTISSKHDINFINFTENWEKRNRFNFFHSNIWCNIPKENTRSFMQQHFLLLSIHLLFIFSAFFIPN